VTGMGRRLARICFEVICPLKTSKLIRTTVRGLFWPPHPKRLFSRSQRNGYPGLMPTPGVFVPDNEADLLALPIESPGPPNAGDRQNQGVVLDER